MASRYWRLLELRTLTANSIGGRDEVIDAGAYRVLEVDCRVPVAGTAGVLKLQHASVNEPEAFRDLTTFALSGGTPGGYWSTDHFLRYVRWLGDANVAGNPKAVVDIIGKE